MEENVYYPQKEYSWNTSYNKKENGVNPYSITMVFLLFVVFAMLYLVFTL